MSRTRCWSWARPSAILWRWGAACGLKGVGLITPSMNTKGELSIRILPDPRLLRRINDRSRFVGSIANAHNLGKTGDELVAQWNELHPDDPVEE